MKRAGDDLPVRTTGNPTSTSADIGTVESQAYYDPRMKSRGGKTKPLTSTEMNDRLMLALTSASEQKSDKVIVKLGAVDWLQAKVPLELSISIALQLRSPEDQANFALTCRQNYMSVDAAFPLRRFPGLSSDLKKTCSGNLMARFDHMQTFEKHIRPDGNYDTALLTPLSPAVRLTTDLAMLVWSSKYTLAKDKKACTKLAVERFKADFKVLKEGSQKDKLDEALDLALRKLQTAPKGKTNKMRSFSFGADELKLIFENRLLDKETSLHLLSEMLLAENHASTLDYALQYIDELPVHTAANLVILTGSNLQTIQHHFVKLNSAAQREALEKITALANKNMAGLNDHHSIDFMNKIVNVISLALFYCQPVQDNAYYKMLSDLLSMLKKCIRFPVDCFIQNNLHLFDGNGPTPLNHMMTGYEWQDVHGKKNWPEFRQAEFGSDSYFMALGYLLRLLNDEIMQFPDTQSAPLQNELKLALLFNFGNPNEMENNM